MQRDAPARFNKPRMPLSICAAWKNASRHTLLGQIRKRELCCLSTELTYLRTCEANSAHSYDSRVYPALSWYATPPALLLWAAFRLSLSPIRHMQPHFGNKRRSLLQKRKLLLFHSYRFESRRFASALRNRSIHSIWLFRTDCFLLSYHCPQRFFRNRTSRKQFPTAE
jgi:hypothetical protein